MKKTKIIATIGPACSDIDELEQLIQNGVDVIRINMSHGDCKQLKKLKGKIDELNEKLKKNIAIMVDLNGPNVRLGRLQNDEIELEEDTKIRIYREEIVGNQTKFSTNYGNLINDVQIGTKIKLGAGIVELKVIGKTEDYILADVIAGGKIRSHASLNTPGTRLNLPFIGKEDDEFIRLSHELGIDFLALSFVSCMEDVLEVQDLLISLDDDTIGVIAKIENEQGMIELDDIIKHVDGVMVARGDLGIEMPIERLPQLQKEIIDKCFKAGKISIVATEMMASMEENPVPTRAEVSDVANAVIEGADCVMLSNETTVGKYPIETVQMMVKIVEAAEENIDYEELLQAAVESEYQDITSLIAYSVAESANRLNCKAIIAPTISGYTAKKISRFRPKCILIAATTSDKVARSLALNFGVTTIILDELNSLDKLISKSKIVANEIIPLEEGDKIVITGGYPFKESKHTNFMKIEEI